MSIKRFFILLVVFSLILLSTAHSKDMEEPIEVLRKPLQGMMEILKDPLYQDAEHKKKQKGKLSDLALKIFNFTEIAKRSLARNWKVFTPQERMDFTNTFKELLENTYINKIQGEFQNEEILFLSQEKISDIKAVVKTVIVRKTGDIPTDYRMICRKKKWGIYDVSIEGVSLVKNYRTQFNDFLSKKSPAKLIDKIKKKVAEIKSEKTKK